MGAIEEVFASLPDLAAFSFGIAREAAAPPLKALLVVAHPDDESECAAFLYRITHELGGIADQVVVTNGEGGHHYAAPAARYYGLPRTDGYRRNARRSGSHGCLGCFLRPAPDSPADPP